MSTACVSCQVPDSKIQKSFLQIASEKIAPLQDAVDLDEATDKEKASLLAWRKYRVLVNRVDTSTAPKIDWPKKPEQPRTL
ncbi:tail fiber assembly protein [Salmonella enterica subsp. enterica serovar Pomona]|nr:tail fiber assembly protein [Salmonella enterica subsp. enterica serovar Pomona]